MDRICSKCGVSKSLDSDHFATDRGRYRRNCKVCDRERKRKWWRKEAEHQRLQRREWELAHPEEVARKREEKKRRREESRRRAIEQVRRHYQENKNHYQQRALANYHKSRPSRLTKQKEYRDNNKEKMKELRRAWWKGQARGRTWRWFFQTRWHGMNSRTINGANPGWNDKRNARYLRKGVELRIMRREFKEWCRQHKDEIEGMARVGLRPSIDRKDHTGHYEINNLQVIPFMVNCTKDNPYKKAA